MIDSAISNHRRRSQVRRYLPLSRRACRLACSTPRLNPRPPHCPGCRPERQPIALASELVMNWLRLTSSRAAARARSECSDCGIRTNSRPLCDEAECGLGTSRCLARASAIHCRHRALDTPHRLVGRAAVHRAARELLDLGRPASLRRTVLYQLDVIRVIELVLAFALTRCHWCHLRFGREPRQTPLRWFWARRQPQKVHHARAQAAAS